MKTHKLKTVNPYFTAAWKNFKFKSFEVRKDDRDFRAGDFIHLLEYESETDNYTGREIRGEITYVLKDFEAIKEGYVVFSFIKSAHIENGKANTFLKSICDIRDCQSEGVHLYNNRLFCEKHIKYVVKP